jgi:hypothetical protein
MTRGLKWGVLAGVSAGIVVIACLDLRHVHQHWGGILAAGVTGLVIFVVRQWIDRPSQSGGDDDGHSHRG